MKHPLQNESEPDDMQDGTGTWRHLQKYRNGFDDCCHKGKYNDMLNKI